MLGLERENAAERVENPAARGRAAEPATAPGTDVKTTGEAAVSSVAKRERTRAASGA